MQMTYEQAMRPGTLMLFARGGSGYMMRSEKRGGAYGSPNRRPPRRKKAGFFYIFFTLLLSVLLWPIGMVMLWQRKVRMTSGTKLLISLLTLCMSVFLIVFALTVPLDNVEFTAFQDKANDWLDKAAADVAVAGDAAMKKTSETWKVMTDFAEAGRAYSGAYTADAIDEGVKLAGQARAAIEGVFHREPTAPVATEAPAQTDAPAVTEAPAQTDAPAATEAPAQTDAPAATEAPAESEAPAETGKPKATKAALIPIAKNGGEATDAPETTEVPGDAAPKTAEPAEDGIDIRLPESEPQAQDAVPLEEGTLHANGDLEPGKVDVPTDAPAVSAGVPLDEATAIPLKPATALPTEAPATAPAEETAAPVPLTPVTEAPSEEATEAPAEEATEAPAETATEAPAEETTEAPAEETTEAPAVAETEAPLEETTEAPTETPVPNPDPGYAVKPAGEATVYFFTNGSVGFHNGPNRHDMHGAPAHTLQEAFDMGKSPCKSCGMPDRSILDVEHIAWVDADNRIHTTDECESFKGHWKLMSLDVALEKGCEPCEACGADFYADEIFPAPTPTPTPQPVTPATALKPAGEAVVYFYESSKGYHSTPDCSSMKNAPAHTLAEAVSSGKGVCRRCNPPAASLLDQPALWQDENGLCHTSDACAAFAGKYKLILRDEALDEGLAGCPDCGAQEYLVPGTVLAK